MDGIFGYDTSHAVVAFQKVNGLTRDAVVGPATVLAIRSPRRVIARFGGERIHVEVDLERQVVILVTGTAVVGVFDASTGSGRRYEKNGSSGVAITPRGDFRVIRTVDAWDHGPLGDLYRPAYFHGGVALHGSTAVPPYPASHGCVRVTIAAMDSLFPRIGVGTAVHVYGR